MADSEVERLKQELAEARERAEKAEAERDSAYETVKSVMLRVVPAISQAAIVGKTYDHFVVVGMVETLIADLQAERAAHAETRQVWEGIAQRRMEEAEHFEKALAHARRELERIDAIMARRPALDKPTRWENVEHAINVAKRADDLKRERDAALALLRECRELAEEAPEDADLLTRLDAVLGGAE